MSAPPDFPGDVGRAGIDGHGQPGPLANNLYGHATLTDEFVLIAADIDKGGGDLFAFSEGIVAIVNEQFSAELVGQAGHVLGRFDFFPAFPVVFVDGPRCSFHFRDEPVQFGVIPFLLVEIVMGASTSWGTIAFLPRILPQLVKFQTGGLSFAPKSLSNWQKGNHLFMFSLLGIDLSRMALRSGLSER